MTAGGAAGLPVPAGADACVVVLASQRSLATRAQSPSTQCWRRRCRPAKSEQKAPASECRGAHQEQLKLVNFPD